ncbi:hypothetical protein ACIBLA_25655 [Streptomyces sp. NPDC050433]|uniref:hypothetical protein n=1 Tax=Streptomyces sp. NPDC050433 TaxID=3365615 RepID=UPI00379C7F00
MIDTQRDTYEEAVAAVEAAYGLRPSVPDAWPAIPAADPRPGPQDLDDDVLGDGWTDQLPLVDQANTECPASVTDARWGRSPFAGWTTWTKPDFHKFSDAMYSDIRSFIQVARAGSSSAASREEVGG